MRYFNNGELFENVRETINKNFQEVLGNTQTNHNDITTEAQRAFENEQNIQQQITTEANTRQNQYQSLQQAINQEIQARESAIIEIEDDLNDEINARENGDETLQANIDAEATARGNAIDAVNENISDETEAREEADEALQEAIDAKQDPISVDSSSPLTYNPTTKALGFDQTKEDIAIIEATTSHISDDSEIDVVADENHFLIASLKDSVKASMISGKQDNLTPEQLAVVNGSVFNSANYSTTEQMNTAIQSAIEQVDTGFLKRKASVQNYSDLPTGLTDDNAGRLYGVVSTDTEYYWINGGWSQLDFSVDLSNFYTKSEIDTILAQAQVALSEEQMAVVNATPFTQTEKTKLAGLSNYNDTALQNAISALQSVKANSADVYLKTDTMSSTQISSAISTAVSNGVANLVSNTRTINGKSLSANITLTASDVGAEATLTGATTKANPVDGDSFYLRDSADSSKTKATLRSSIKATLKTYFDTIYTTTTAVGTQISNALSNYVPTSRTVAGKALSSNITLAKGDVGLGNVDNTADTAKPVSTAQQTALNGKLNTTDALTTVSVTNKLLTQTDNKTVNATSITYDSDGRLTQVVDGSTTTNVSRTDFDSQNKVYIQDVGDAKKTTITYTSEGVVASIIYA